MLPPTLAEERSPAPKKSGSPVNTSPTEAPFKELFESAPVAYHEIDAAGVLCRVNLTECHMLGYRPEEMIGHPVWEFVAADQQEECRRAIRRKIAGEEPLASSECDSVRRDVGYLILETYEGLIRNASG